MSDAKYIAEMQRKICEYESDLMLLNWFICSMVNGENPTIPEPTNWQITDVIRMLTKYVDDLRCNQNNQI